MGLSLHTSDLGENKDDIQPEYNSRNERSSRRTMKRTKNENENEIKKDSAAAWLYTFHSKPFLFSPLNLYHKNKENPSLPMPAPQKRESKKKGFIKLLGSKHAQSQIFCGCPRNSCLKHLPFPRHLELCLVPYPSHRKVLGARGR